jgi:mono/diheme cytochrome c family protein
MMSLYRRFHFSIALMAGLLAFASLPLFSKPDPGAKQEKTPAQQQAKQSASNGDQDAGERKFKQNCSRCHTAPEGFSPRISGTILRHMRVRASLSAQDERDILHFLNP